jgi:hypothetical protein
VFTFARTVIALTLSVSALAASGTHAQRAARARLQAEQTEFGSETVMSKPVQMPKDVVAQMLETDGGRLKECLKQEGQTEADVPKHFTASEVNVNDDGARDLVVQAQSLCFMGAHLTVWWVFSKVGGGFGARVGPGYDLVFTGGGDGLKVLKTATNGFRDIETMSFSGAGTQFSYTVWKFDGGGYKARICTVKNGRKVSRVKCAS